MTRLPGLGTGTVLFDSTLAVANATIDTGAGGFSTAFSVLFIYGYLRTDEAGVTSQVLFTVNNDTGANYDRTVVSVVNTTVAGGTALAQTAWAFSMPGSSYGANVFGVVALTLPNYSASTGFQMGVALTERLDTAAANAALINGSIGWRSSAAITRVAVTTFTGGQKLVAGSRLIVAAL